MKLNFKESGAGQPLLILHGFMGSLDNWQSLSNQFSKYFRVFIIDQRNHGKSPHSNEHSLDLMVEDLYEFIEEHKLQQVVLLGHSMGGKVAMKFALTYPFIVDKLIIADIAPRQYKRGHDDVFEAIFAVPIQQLTSRKEAEQAMEPYVTDMGTRQFLLKNLERKEDGTYQWKMNLSALHKDYEEIIKPITSEQPFPGSTLVLKGELSRYISIQDQEDMADLFPNFKIETIPNAGHWLHADNPQAFYNEVISFAGSD